MENNEVKKIPLHERLAKSNSFKQIASSVISILIGIGVGFVIMLISSFFLEDADPLSAISGLGVILAGPFNGAAPLISFGDMIFYSVPLIFTGLSVAIAMKTGLFNIGASGQFLMGALGALLVALNINTTGNRFAGVMVWLLAVLVAIILATLWGMIPGFLKAYFGINEVIVCIMTNWIAAQIVTWVFSTTTDLINVGAGKSAYLITTKETGNYTPKLGLDKVFSYMSSSSYIDIGIFIAIGVAVLLWVIMNKTTFGYELKACGANKDASKYAGMNEKRNIVLSMGIAGALSGLAAALYYLNPGIELQFKSIYQTLPAFGFNGIPVALLAGCSPIGTIFTAIFIRYISAASTNLVEFNKYFADIIIAVIIYLAGFSRVFINVFNKKKKGGSK